MLIKFDYDSHGVCKGCVCISLDYFQVELN